LDAPENGISNKYAARRLHLARMAAYENAERRPAFLVTLAKQFFGSD
jgi:hypothetical protein